jgi:hypothetical protein
MKRFFMTISDKKNQEKISKNKIEIKYIEIKKIHFYEEECNKIVTLMFSELFILIKLKNFLI